MRADSQRAEAERLRGEADALRREVARLDRMVYGRPSNHAQVTDLDARPGRRERFATASQRARARSDGDAERAPRGAAGARRR
jgi:hypothetical protein